MAAPTIETSIWLALRSRVETLPLVPALATSWPNESFTPPAPAFSYLEVAHIPNRSNRVTIGGKHQLQGILQISLQAKQNENAAVAIEIAGKIAAHFPADFRLSHGNARLRIKRRPDVGQPGKETTRLHIPVTIEYEAFA